MKNSVPERRPVSHPQSFATLDPLEPRTLYSANPLPASELSTDFAAAVVVAGDAYEVNNSVATAFNLETAQGSLSELAGLATATDNDWYRVQAGAGRFEAELQLDAAEGDLNLQIFTAEGSLITGAYSVEDNSSVGIDVTEDTELLLFVYSRGDNYQGNGYNLTWNAVDPATGPVDPVDPEGPVDPVDPEGPVDPVDPEGPVDPVDPEGPVDPVDPEGPVDPVDPEGPVDPVDPEGPVDPVDPEGPVDPVDPEGPVDPINPTAPVAGTEDSFEDNNSRQTATVLPTASGSLAATSTDNDWYRLDVLAGDQVTFTLSNVVAEGDLNIELYGASGGPLTGRYNVEPVSEVSFTLDADGPIFAFIYSRGDNNQGNVYQLAWTGGETTEPIDPVDPVDPEGPVDPVDPEGPVNPVDPEGPVDPVDPEGPVDPVDPEGPVDPVDPEGPVDPVDPEGPVDPVDPEGPVDPVDPEGPVDPVDPEGPVDPVDPEGPVDPVDPEGPVDPVDPEGPVDPLNPTAPVAGTEDSFEDNNSRQTATVLPTASGSLAATSTDNDWYRLDVLAGDQVTFTLSNVVAEGDLNIELYGASGGPLTGRYNVEPVSEVSVTLDADGPIFAFIYSRGDNNQGNVYQLAWSGGETTEPIDPVDPVDPEGPVDPVDPEGPVDPVDPEGPVDPVDPEGPVDPVDPEGPVDPVDPEGPVDPVDPEGPVDPVDPEGPVDPVDPEGPVDPVDPEGPVDPINPTAPVAGTEDSFEDNNSRQTATVLPTASGSLAATSTDNDWYRLDVLAGDQVTFTLSNVVAEGDLNIELYGASGGPLTGRYNVEPVSEVSFTLDADGPIFAFIYSRGDNNQGNVYQLAWTGGETTEPIDPVDPVDPEGPVDPVDPEGPVDPVDPEGPVDPVDPEGPVDPVDPEGPVDPVDPEGPVDPVDPEGPVDPVDPEGPVDPVDPEGPVDPVDPEGPVDPLNPTAPVAGTEDSFEDNNSRQTATVLPTASGFLEATSTDNDWYRLDGLAGDQVTFTLSNVVAEGDLNIELYGASGGPLTGRYNVEPVSEVSVTLDADGPVFAFIYSRGDNNQGNVYQLAWTGGEAAEPIDPVDPTDPSDPGAPSDPTDPTIDVYEDNNTLATAFVLSGVNGSLLEDQGLATATDADFYRVTVGAGDFTAAVSSVDAPGTLRLSLFDADGVLIAESADTLDQPALSATLDTQGEYVLQVSLIDAASDAAVVYDLNWDGQRFIEPFPVLEPVIREGVAAWVQAALTDRADVLVLGDSVVFIDGVGWDGGLSAGFDRTLGLAGTGLLSGNFTNSNGAGYGYESFGQNPSNWFFEFVPGTDVDALTNDEINSDEFARSQHPFGQITVNPGRGTATEIGVQVSAQGDTAEPDRAFTFEAYVSGDGAVYNVTRTAADGTTEAVGLQQVVGEETQKVSFAFAAGETAADAFQSVAITEPSPLSFIPFGSDRTLNETPLTVSNFRLLETGSTGATVTSWGYGGESTREFVEEQYRPLGQENRAEILNRVVDGGSGKLLVFIMEGLNDRNETQASLNGIEDANSSEAFVDNVSTLIAEVRSDWEAAGNDASDLEFVTFGTYDQNSDVRLEGYSAALQQHALDNEGVSFIDLRTLSEGLTLDEMVELGFINGVFPDGSGEDFIHVTEAGAVFYGEAIASLLAATATPELADTPSEATDTATAAAGLQLFDADGVMQVERIETATNSEVSFALPPTGDAGLGYDLSWSDSL